MTTVATPQTPNSKAPPADPWDDNAPRPSRPVTVQPDRRRPPPPPAPVYKLAFSDPGTTCDYPLLLVEGPEYSGKSTMAVELSNDPRIGQTWMLSVGEEVRWLRDVGPFRIVNHNGEWWQILSAVEQLHALATTMKESGEKTPLLIVDSGTKIWELLSGWAENRARSSQDSERKLMLDPNAEINVGHAYWNPANRRHRKLVALLRSMPAIVVITARGKWVSAFDAAGKPVPNAKAYSVQAQSELGYATKAWVRLSPDGPPQIVGARLARGGIRAGQDQPRPITHEFSLAWLVFDVLKFDPACATPGQSFEPAPDAAPDSEVTAPARVVPADADEAPGMAPADVIHPAVK